MQQPNHDLEARVAALETALTELAKDTARLAEQVLPFVQMVGSIAPDLRRGLAELTANADRFQIAANNLEMLRDLAKIIRPPERNN